MAVMEHTSQQPEDPVSSSGLYENAKLNDHEAGAGGSICKKANLSLPAWSLLSEILGVGPGHDTETELKLSMRNQLEKLHYLKFLWKKCVWFF